MTRASERIATGSASKRVKSEEQSRSAGVVPDEEQQQSVGKNKRKSGMKHVEPVVSVTGIVRARQRLQDVLLQEVSRSELLDDNSDDADGSPCPQQKQAKKQRMPRKVRKNTQDDIQAKQTALVIKLFDRSVDCGKFIAGVGDEDIPLYPICREWMRNGREQSFDSPLLGTDSSKDPLAVSAGDKKQGIQRLPNPIPLSDEMRNRGLDPRIPKSVSKPQTSKSEIDAAINSEDSIPDLLQQSLSRWRQIRSEWREAGRENELRYKHSCDVLKSMFDKSTSAQTDLIEPKVEPLDTSY